MFSVLAPAKINLTLEVLGKRPDGYHEIRSLMQTIDLCDRLRFRLGQNTRFVCDKPELVVAKSLISQATFLLNEATGCAKGATIEITKNIPLSSGLGGDSSDAAAILSGLNKLWQLGLSQEKLLELALKLGSDVPFFLYGGTALVEGRGEKITKLPPLPQQRVVLMIPDLPRLAEKTKRLYASLKPVHYTDGKISENFVKELKAGKELKLSMLFNTFENVAFDQFPDLKTYKEHFTKLGARNIHLAGSGPALFTMIKDKAEAERLYASLQKQNVGCYLATLLRQPPPD
jgi:4-diphosphocytidyl-2-C-methyl-D-erythritol kinase